MKKTLKPDTALAPIPVVMVSCGNMEKSNIITIAWTGVINTDPPLVYISVRQSRYSYNIIAENKEFVINIPNEQLVKEADYCGTKSGKNEDKFLTNKLTKQEANIIKAPIIKECPVNLECKVKEIKHLGSHDMFIAEIVQIHAKEEYIKENGTVDLAKVKPITYFGQEYYISEKKIADRGIGLMSKRDVS